MSGYTQRRDRDWFPGEDLSAPCVLCDEPGGPLEVGGHDGRRELSVCRDCELNRYPQLVDLVDDLVASDSRSLRKATAADAGDCRTCGAPTCDCPRGAVLGDYWEQT